MSLADKLMKDPTALMQTASKARGIDSLAWMPVKGVLNAVGKVGEWTGLRQANKVGLGDQLVGRHFIEPTEKFVHSSGQFMGELPVVGGLFKHKLSPDDVMEAARRVDLTPEQIGQLTQQAHKGELVTHRLTAPLESKFTKMFVLPAMGAMYLQEKLDQRQKDRILNAPYKAQQAAASQQRLTNVQRLAGAKFASTERKEDMSPSEENNFIQKAEVQEQMMKRASVTINGLTQQMKQATIVIESTQKEIGLYKKAAQLASEGGLEPHQIAQWVDENMRQTKQAMNGQSGLESAPPLSLEQSGDGMLDLFAQTSGTIPEHAKLGSLAPPVRGEGRRNSSGERTNARRGGRSALAGFNDIMGLDGL